MEGDIEVMSNVDVAVARLEVQVERLEADMQEMKGDIRFIRKKLDEASGGWKVFMFVGGVGMAIGGLLIKILSMIPWK